MTDTSTARPPASGLARPHDPDPGSAIAIVGSGPAGCYLAQALRRLLPGAHLTVFDRLPVPYGLLRYGVAGDHQGTKAVSRQFDRLFTRGRVGFAGNVEIGTDLTLQALREAYDAVVLCTGLHQDLPLGIPGEMLDGVVGSGRLTRLLNSHPDEVAQGVRTGAQPVVIGAGNVAMDVVRLLVQTAEERAGSDLDEPLLHTVTSRVRRVEVISRSPLAQAKFDVTMLRELGELPGLRFEVHEDRRLEPADAGGESRRGVAMQLAARAEPHARAVISLRFGYRPVRLLGHRRVTGVVLRPTGEATGETTLPADCVVTAIGYGRDRHDPLSGRDVPHRQGGRVEPGLYVGGWLSTGPHGTIPAQRTLARQIAGAVVTELAGRADRPPRGGFEALPSDIRARSVDFGGWSLIDRFERAQAAPDRVRRKVRDREQLLAIAAGRSTNIETPHLTRSPV